MTFGARDIADLERLLSAGNSGFPVLEGMLRDIKDAQPDWKPSDDVCRMLAAMANSPPGSAWRDTLEFLLDITARAPMTVYPAGTETLEGEAMSARAWKARQQVAGLIVAAVNHGRKLQQGQTMEADHDTP